MDGTRLKIRRRMITANYFNEERPWLVNTAMRSARQSGITAWSPGMSRRLRMFVDNFREDFSVMVTLTYPEVFPKDGREVKRHWRAFIERVRRTGWLDYGSLVWFLEFQRRGAPHIHFLATSWISKALVASAWSSVTGGNPLSCSRTEALRDAERAGAYARKYASKSEQKDVPPEFVNVGRMWGCVGRKISEQGLPRLPVVEADILRAAPAFIEKICSTRMDSCRVFETMSGWVMYGTEREIQDTWRYLQDAFRFVGRDGKPLVNTRQKTWVESPATHVRRVKPMMQSSLP